VSTYNSLQAYFQRTNPKTYAICLKLIFLYSSNLVLKDFNITQTSFFVIMVCNSWLLYNNILGKGIEYQAEVQNKMQKAEDENISVDAIKLHKHTYSTFFAMVLVWKERRILKSPFTVLVILPRSIYCLLLSRDPFSSMVEEH